LTVCSITPLLFRAPASFCWWSPTNALDLTPHRFSPSPESLKDFTLSYSLPSFSFHFFGQDVADVFQNFHLFPTAFPPALNKRVIPLFFLVMYFRQTFLPFAGSFWLPFFHFEKCPFPCRCGPVAMIPPNLFLSISCPFNRSIVLVSPPPSSFPTLSKHSTTPPKTLPQGPVAQPL